MNRLLSGALLALLLAGAGTAARADAADTLREFVRDVKTGRADFTQTVTSPDGAKKKTSSGSFEFARPNRFRFAYVKPYEQLIVGDGRKVWIFDADLNQASSRAFSAALGASPAALLAGAALEQDFNLAVSPNSASNGAPNSAPDKDGLVWALATPKAKDGAFQSVRVGFRGKDLAAVEIVDSFGQRSLLQFSHWMPNSVLRPEAFKFVPPPGADVIEQ